MAFFQSAVGTFTDISYRTWSRFLESGEQSTLWKDTEMTTPVRSPRE